MHGNLGYLVRVMLVLLDHETTSGAEQKCSQGTTRGTTGVLASVSILYCTWYTNALHRCAMMNRPFSRITYLLCSKHRGDRMRYISLDSNLTTFPDCLEFSEGHRHQSCQEWRRVSPMRWRCRSLGNWAGSDLSDCGPLCHDKCSFVIDRRVEKGHWPYKKPRATGGRLCWLTCKVNAYNTCVLLLWAGPDRAWHFVDTQRNQRLRRRRNVS